MKKLVIAFLFALLAPTLAVAANCSTYPYTLINGQLADANQVMSNFNTILGCANANLAHNGVNSDITSLTALNSLTNAGNSTISGNETVGGTFGATGNSTFGGTLGVTGATTLSSTLTVGSTLGVTGLTTLSGGAAITGTATVGGQAIVVTNDSRFGGVLQNAQSAAYTLVLADAGKQIYHPSADTTARTWTVPANASVAFAIGTKLDLVNDCSAGTVTIQITSDTLVYFPSGSTGSRTFSACGEATLTKVGTTRWIISGVGLS